MAYMRSTGPNSRKGVFGPRCIHELQPTMKLATAFLVLCVALLSHSSECPPASAPCPLPCGPQLSGPCCLYSWGTRLLMLVHLVPPRDQASPLGFPA